MKRIALLALLMSLNPAGAQSVKRNAPLSLVPDNAAIENSDIPTKVGIEPDLPYVTPGGKLGHWGVGNGGDWMRINFARARDYAANIVLKIKPNSLSRIKDVEIQTWILKNQKFLAADILQTEHVWVQEAKPTCAFTVPPGLDGKVPTSNPIEFSYPTCRNQLQCSGTSIPNNPDAPMNFTQVAQLLIHEAAHHFNANEATADLIAIGIMDAWKSGLMDSTPIDLTNAPPGTHSHGAVWTGDRMIIVGGLLQDNTFTNAVSSYDPNPKDGSTPKWTSIALPTHFTITPRSEPQVIWTGKEVFIWGGFTGTSTTKTWLFDGALYNPTTNTWVQVNKPSNVNDLNWNFAQQTAVDKGPHQTVVWTGSVAIVFGGTEKDTGLPLAGIFDPSLVSNSTTGGWSRMAILPPTEYMVDKTGRTVAVPYYAPQQGHVSSWTGESMIVWGGYNSKSGAGSGLNSGAVYNLSTNSWKKMSTVGAPLGRTLHQAVWTGERYIVISGGGVGSSTEITSTGGLYDPATDTWTSFKSELMAERKGHKAVWNGEEILIIGGITNRSATYLGEVFAFNPATLQYRILRGSVNPTTRSSASIVWTGSSALVWGGFASGPTNGNVYSVRKSGAQYYP